MVLCGQVQLSTDRLSPGASADHLSTLAAQRRQSGLFDCAAVGQGPSSADLNPRAATSHVSSRSVSRLIYVQSRDVTDSKSASESDGIRHFSRNPKSVAYLKSDRNGFKIFMAMKVGRMVDLGG